MIYKEIEGVLIVFTLTTGVMGARRASVGNVRPGPMLVVHDGVSMAHMRRPFASYLCFGVSPSDSIGSRGRLVSRRRFRFWVSLGLAWGSGELLACGGASVPMPVVW